MSEVRTLARQTMVYGLGTVVPRFLNYAILTFFYTRFFDKSEYGVVTELYAWMVFLLIVLTYGMETGFFRFSQDEEKFERTYSTTLISLFVSSLLFLVLVFSFIGPVSALLNYPENRDYIKMFAGIVAIDAFTAIPYARLRKENKALIFSVIKISNVAITIVAVIFLLIIAPDIYENSNGFFRRIYNPDYRVGYVFVANLIGSLSSLLMLTPWIFKIRVVFDRKIWTTMIAYSFPLLIAGLSGTVNDTLDKVIMRRVVGNDQGLEVVGEYGAGYKIAVLMALVIQMFRFAAEPFFFERAGKADAEKTYGLVMKYFVIAMLLIYLVINLYIVLFQHFIGPSFRDSIIVVPIVSMGYLLYGVYVNHSIWYKIKDLTHFGIYITLTGAIITALMNIYLLPVFGYMASAWAHVFSYGAMIILSFLFAAKRYRIDYNIKDIIPYFIIAISFVIANILIEFKNIFIELTVSTVMIVAFILFAQKKDRIINVLKGGV